MKRKFVDEFHWLEEDEMLDLAALAQASPGAAALVLTAFLRRTTDCINFL